MRVKISLRLVMCWMHFLAIECDPATRHNTAFRGHNQVMERLRMPQGASNSGPVFTRVMRGAFKHIPRE